MNENKISSRISIVTAMFLCILIGGMASFITYIVTLNQTKHTVTIEQNKKWIEKCEKARDKDKLHGIAKEKREFQEALSNSIIKLQPKLDKLLADRIASVIISECKTKELDPILITALIWIESRFDILAHSNKGAVGLMQIRYTIWKDEPALKNNGVDSKSKLYWIDLNIRCGTKIFTKYYKESKHDIVKTLHRYNSGSKDLPESKKFYEIGYANKVVLTAYRISDSMKKDNNDLPSDH